MKYAGAIPADQFMADMSGQKNGSQNTDFKDKGTYDKTGLDKSEGGSYGAYGVTKDVEEENAYGLTRDVEEDVPPISQSSEPEKPEEVEEDPEYDKTENDDNDPTMTANAPPPNTPPPDSNSGGGENHQYDKT